MSTPAFVITETATDHPRTPPEKQKAIHPRSGSPGKRNPPKWRMAYKPTLPLIPLNPRRWCPNLPAFSLQAGSTEHPNGRVIGLGETCFTLPLRDSAGLVHLNVTGLPPLCAAHPGIGRTHSETDSIVPAIICPSTLACQPDKSQECIPISGRTFLRLGQQRSRTHPALHSRSDVAPSLPTAHCPLPTDY